MNSDVDKTKTLNFDMKVKKGKFGKMRRIRVVMKANGLAPKNIDNTGKEEDVENDDEEGGQGEDEDAAAVVHPTVDGVVVVPEVRRDYEKKIKRQKKTTRQLFPLISGHSLRLEDLEKKRKDKETIFTSQQCTESELKTDYEKKIKRQRHP